MIDIQPTLQSDSYKQGHYPMYPEGMEFLYSNGTARKSRIPDVKSVVFVGLEPFLQEYLLRQYDKLFFSVPWAEVERIHLEHVRPFCGGNEPVLEQWYALWRLGYLPLHIKALPEGTVVPIGVPCWTITNTQPGYGWLVNFIETIMSTCMWQTIVSATISKKFREETDRQVEESGMEPLMADFLCHDFSPRGMSSLESMMYSGAGFLTSSKGSDNIPAAMFLKKYYRTGDELIAASVPATEHSVMCAGTKHGEIETFTRLLELFPKGILSVVSDTWDLWVVLMTYLPMLRKEIMAREGTLVIRPDSGDPVDIICGWDIPTFENSDIAAEFYQYNIRARNVFQLKDNPSYYEVVPGTRWGYKGIAPRPEFKGVIQLLWDTFGGTITSKGYKLLDSHVGAIYGDAITYERHVEIGKRLMKKGFAPSVVKGIGSFTLQYNTRDSIGMAIKATSIVVNGVRYAIFKDPVTSDGEKKSAKGLLAVFRDADGNIYLEQDVDPEVERTGLLQTRFINSRIFRTPNLKDIRDLVKSQKLI